MPFQAGSLIGSYRVQSTLGSGAFATVYNVRKSGTQDVYAMKVCHNRGQAAKLSKHEITILLEVQKNDPTGRKNCVALLDQFTLENGFTCLVFPLLARSLYSFLEKNDNLPFPRAHVQQISYQLLNALAFIHSIGIVHCDVKSDNILLTHNNYFISQKSGLMRKVLHEPKICLSDFGIARIINGEKQPDMGKSPFLAPEFCLGIPWDYSIDVYAAGLIMHELITGKSVIPPGMGIAQTLAYLHAIKGPLPEHVTEHAMQATNIPFKYADPLLPQQSNPVQVDFNGLGMSRTKILDTRIKQLTRNLAKTTEIGGVAFVDLVDRMLEYNPAERLRAKDALGHAYFTVQFPLPKPVNVLPR